jgi:thiol:disulfide interchange protein
MDLKGASHNSKRKFSFTPVGQSVQIDQDKGVNMSEIKWQSDYESAVKEAIAANKPVLLELYMDGCGHCTRLHKETLVDEQVVAVVNAGFVPVRIEGRGRMDLVKKFEVKGAPTTLILSPQEQEKHRFIGFQSPMEYIQELGKIN